MTSTSLDLEETHGGYKLLRGVRQDIRTLLNNFEKTESVRFEDFSEEWQKMKFSLIFRERKLIPELLEFSEEIIHIAKGYLAQPWNFHIRVGALYTLYGLYFKQPIMKVAKIRFTKEEWRDLGDLVNKCKEAKHYDVVLIHYKLYINRAYVFTVLPRATGFEKGFRKYEQECKLNKCNLNEMILNRKEVIDPNVLSSLASMEKCYSEKKAEFLGKKNLEFVDKGYAISLKKKIDDFYSKITVKLPNINEEVGKEVQNGTSNRSDTAEGNGQVDSLAARRLKIKSKAFGLTSVSSEESASPKAKEPKVNKGQRKKRKLMNSADDSLHETDQNAESSSNNLCLPIL